MPPLFRSVLPKNLFFHQTLILIITFIAYASLHASRKPPSIVKSVLGPEISKNGTTPLHDLSSSQMGWPPFNGTQGTHRLAVAGVHLSHETAGMLSTIFDFGGVLGGVLAGLISDKLEARAITSVSFLLLSIPALVLYRVYGSSSMLMNNILMFFSGSLVNGPYALITTAVAADLGTQTAIRGNSRALATVTAIIDGTGSIGAAIGPVVVGYISTSGWNTVFAILIASIFTAALSLIPAVKSELMKRKSRTQLNGAAY